VSQPGFSFGSALKAASSDASSAVTVSSLASVPSAGLLDKLDSMTKSKQVSFLDD